MVVNQNPYGTELTKLFPIANFERWKFDAEKNNAGIKPIHRHSKHVEIFQAISSNANANNHGYRAGVCSDTRTFFDVHCKCDWTDTGAKQGFSQLIVE